MSSIGQKTLISVLVTTYNQEQYIEKALRSVLEQECDADIELLVGDDCSTDNTPEIIEKLAAEFPHIIKPTYNKFNVGMSQNLYNQLLISRGGVIAYLDGDDWWTDKYKLQKQVSYLLEHPECGLVVSYARAYDQKSNTYQGLLGNSDVCNFEKLMFSDADVQSQTMLFRKELLLAHQDNLRWYVDNNCFFDSIIAYYFAYYSKIHFMEEELAVYRILPNSGCHSTDKQKQLAYAKRYFAIKSRFMIDNNVKSDLCHSIIINEWEKAFQYGAWTSERQIRNSRRYKLGAFLLDMVSKFKLNKIR